MLPVDLDFRAGNSIEVDLTQYVDMGRIDFIQSVYINMRNIPYNLTLGGYLGPHEVFCKAGHSVYMPLPVGDDPKFTASISGPYAQILQIAVSNVPFFPFDQLMT